MQRLRHYALASLMLLGGCDQEQMAGGSGAGNPPLARVSLALKANSLTAASAASVLRKTADEVQRNPDGSFTVTDSSGARIRISAIMAQVRRVDFLLPHGLACPSAGTLSCQDNEVMVWGPFAVDLMTGKAIPPLDRIRVPAGLYSEVELEMGDNDSGAAADSAADLVLSGSTDSARGPVRNFTVALSLSDGLEFDDSLGLHISADSVNNVLLRLDVDDWFRDADLSGCVATRAADSADVTRMQGDGFCGGAGLRIRKRIEASGEFDWQDAFEP
jgi:hypothetical protein